MKFKHRCYRDDLAAALGLDPSIVERVIERQFLDEWFVDGLDGKIDELKADLDASRQDQERLEKRCNDLESRYAILEEKLADARSSFEYIAELEGEATVVVFDMKDEAAHARKRLDAK